MSEHTAITRSANPTPARGNHKDRRPRTRLRLRAGTAVLALGALTASLAVTAAPAAAEQRQATLSTRSAPIITTEGLQFRDLDRDGALTPYEDWRLTPTERAADLMGRMTFEQKAGLLVHGTLPLSGTSYAVAPVTDLIGQRKMTTFVTRLSTTPSNVATASNLVQEIAEKQPLGIPVVISTDPRNGFSVAEGQTVARVGTTAMPDATGQAATNDPALVRQLTDIARQEYRAVGITEALSPQADIATEPRWSRANGTFGSDPEDVSTFVEAYVEGMQAGSKGLSSQSVATVTKHWVGYGAAENGFESHYYFGRFATFPGNSFAKHLVPFEGAFKANTAGIMPTYSILKDLVYNGTTVEQVGAGFNSFLLQDLLRDEYGFKGVIVSDFGITGTCTPACLVNRPPASHIGPWGSAKPWGVEDKTVLERFALSITAGVDQIGGSNEPSYVVQAVQQGLLTAARVDESAERVLKQKFELGLFENPYVDAAAAAAIAGSAAFSAVGDAAQAKSLTLLTNNDQLLPAAADSNRNVWLSGVAASAATASGYTVVTDLAQADLAVVRLRDPRGGIDLTDLNFTGGEADYKALQAAVDAGVPTVAVPKLDRPLVLTNVVDRAGAVLANYGVSDTILMQTIAGQRQPGGDLPFELPSSMTAVLAQLSDVPDDSADPLFPVGYGLEYASPTIASLTAILQTYRDSADVRGSIAPRLAANLSAAQRFADRGRTAQAAQEIQQFLDRLDNVPVKSYVSPAAKAALQKEARVVLAGLR